MADQLKENAAGGAGAIPAPAAPAAGEELLVIKLKKPYKFEGAEYAEIDLRGIRGLRIRDAIDIQKELLNRNESAAAMVPETTTAFCRAVAARALKKPGEFFDFAPRGLNKRVVYAVRFVLNVDMDTSNHVMRFEEPYAFNGKVYADVDLSGIADLNSMNESAAENRLVSEGFAISEPTFNFLYSCVIASYATGLPEAFFTGLPFCELSKLKNAVNAADFFE